MFDPSGSTDLFKGISLGNILTVITILISQWGMHNQNIKRMAKIDFKVNIMWKEFAKRFNLPEDIDKMDGD